MKKPMPFVIVCAAIVMISCSKNKTETQPPPPPPPPPPPTITFSKSNVRGFMVDTNATAQTVALFYNLKMLSKTGFAVGQQDAFSGFYNDIGGFSDIKKTTGNDPAILGSDFIFITDKNNNGQATNWFYQKEVGTINQVIEAYNKGIVNIFAWHIRDPYEEKTFYASELTATQKANSFRSLLPGGENHNWYKLKLDKVASVFNKLIGKNGELIPVIFRPFHEYDGSWFWWGADFCTPEEYKTLFQFTVDYLKNTKGIHNVLYSLGPDRTYDTKDKYLSRYPGDKYVDILGMDNYGDFDNGRGDAGATLANKKLKVISDLAIERTKIAALTEAGYQVSATKAPIAGWFSNYVYNALTSNNIEIAFVMFWGNSKDAYYVPAPSSSNASDFIDFTNKSKSLLINEIPNMYVIPN